jgi:hypothetical protein
MKMISVSEKYRFLWRIIVPPSSGLKSKSRNQQEQAAGLAGGDMFLQNFGLSLNFMTLQPRRLCFS